MSSGNSIIRIDGISKPAELLIQKVSEAIGGVFRPYQIMRVARAKAQAAVIEAQTQIKITDLQRRALRRFIAEEAKKQNNIETITEKAIPRLSGTSKPQDMEDDWVANFFDKCRIVSDEQMQTLWAKVLAGEANSPGSYAKRTVNFLASLDKSEAELFTALCAFVWDFGAEISPLPLVYDPTNSLFTSHGITFWALTQLDAVGLIRFDSVGGFRLHKIPKGTVLFRYYGTPLIVELSKEENELETGHVLLSNVGSQLSRICQAKPIDGFFDYVVQKWAKQGLQLSSPYPRAEV